MKPVHTSVSCLATVQCQLKLAPAVQAGKSEPTDPEHNQRCVLYASAPAMYACNCMQTTEGCTRCEHAYREAARDLSRCCSRLGLAHAAVVLEHASLGSSVSLQYRAILHSKLLALNRRNLCSSTTTEAEQVPLPTSFTHCIPPELLHAAAMPFA